MRQTVLPDGTSLWAPSPLEAAVLYREIITERTYERHGIRVAPGDIVFDVGANIGLFAIHMARTVPGVHVHAFEPLPPLFETLSRNLEALAPEVHAHHVALSDHAGEATFELDPFLTMNAIMDANAVRDAADHRAPASAWAAAALADLNRVQPNRLSVFAGRALRQPIGRIAVLTVLAPLAVALSLRHWWFVEHHTCRLQTLPAAMRAAGVDHVDLVKVDVEGAEEAVLAGVDDACWSRVRQFVIEVHDVGGRLDRLRTRLEAHGFRTACAREDWALHELLGIYTLYATRA